MSNIHSLSDLKKKSGTGAGNQPADYYAGGIGNDGGGSGVAIQMPNDPIAAIVQNASAAGGGAGAGGEPGSGDIAVELFRNGFFVVNRGTRGPFRSKDDSANHVFLADLRRGQVPRELADLAAGSGAGLALKLINRSEEDHKEPPKPKEAFTGGGQKLAAPSYGAVAETGGAPAGPRELVLKDGEKVVKMRVRLANGKPLTVSCNGSHTVGEVKAHVQFHSGGAAAPEFLLLAGRPPKPLTDLGATVDAAKLRGESLIQRPK